MNSKKLEKLERNFYARNHLLRVVTILSAVYGRLKYKEDAAVCYHIAQALDELYEALKATGYEFK